MQHRGRDQLTCNELMNRDYPVPPGLKHQALCVLNELQAARDLATRLDKDPNSIVEPYLQELLKLCSPTIKPVSVAERLPGLDDFDAEGHVWAWRYQDPEKPARLHFWTRIPAKWLPDSLHWRYWLPHYALPLPTSQED